MALQVWACVVETKCFRATATKLVMSVSSNSYRSVACVILLSKGDEGMLLQGLRFRNFPGTTRSGCDQKCYFVMPSMSKNVDDWFVNSRHSFT